MFQTIAQEIFDYLRRFVFALSLVVLLCAPECNILWLSLVADEPSETPITQKTKDLDALKSATIANPDAKSELSGTSEITATDLLAEELQKNWEHFSSKENVALGDVWKVRGNGEARVLICVGDPKGFLYTRKEFADFELTFEWKYEKDPDGNSGVLVFTQNEPRLWPTSMQVQLHQPSAGAVFPSGDAKSDNSTDPTGPPLALGVGEWNTCEITGRNGRLSVKVNGRIAGEVSGCKPASGRIAIQSEGSETHFRKMQIRVLEPLPQLKPVTAEKNAAVAPTDATASGRATVPAISEK